MNDVIAAVIPSVLNLLLYAVLISDSVCLFLN